MNRDQIFWGAFNDELEKMAAGGIVGAVASGARSLGSGLKAGAMTMGSAARKAGKAVFGSKGQTVVPKPGKTMSLSEKIQKAKSTKLGPTVAKSGGPAAAAPAAKAAPAAAPAPAPAAAAPAPAAAAATKGGVGDELKGLWESGKARWGKLSPGAKWAVGGAGAGLGLLAARGLMRKKED